MTEGIIFLSSYIIYHPMNRASPPKGEVFYDFFASVRLYVLQFSTICNMHKLCLLFSKIVTENDNFVNFSQKPQFFPINKVVTFGECHYLRYKWYNGFIMIKYTHL